MKKKAKAGQQSPAQAGVHPETQDRVKRGLADESSSKASSGEQRDTRTGHDKDANEEHARDVRKHG